MSNVNLFTKALQAYVAEHTSGVLPEDVEILGAESAWDEGYYGGCSTCGDDPAEVALTIRYRVGSGVHALTVYNESFTGLVNRLLAAEGIYA